MVCCLVVRARKPVVAWVRDGNKTVIPFFSLVLVLVLVLVLDLVRVVYGSR